MKNLDEIYPRGFFSARKKLWGRHIVVANLLKTAFAPRSFVDVGCAMGEVVYGMRQLGVAAVGIEGSSAAFRYMPEDLRPYVYLLDLRFPIGIGHYDLATCLEVAEHIEPEYADQLVSNLCGLSDTLLMSMAPPGQGGTYHVNCQQREYWDKKFLDNRFVHNADRTRCVKKLMEPHKKTLLAWYQNLAVYEKTNH